MKNKKLQSKYFALLIILALSIVLVIKNPVSAKIDPTRQSQETSYEEIDAYVEKELRSLNIPGGILTVIEGDNIMHTKGFGVTGPSKNTPSPQTPFFIGSLTKSFTSLAVMQLVEAGKINLDTPVEHYLPWFKLADPIATKKITVRHLLNQTSGISQIPGMINLANFDEKPGASERQARTLASIGLTNPVGLTWEYSNVNYNLLGLIIEAVSGETYADYIQKHIFSPLDMHNSYTDKSSAKKNGLVVGHEMWFGFPIAVPDLLVPLGSLSSGQLISSAEDISHYLIAQLNKGQYASTQILSPDGVAQMHKPAVMTVSGPANTDYGMGWFINHTSKGQIIYHYGEVPDFFAYMALIPQQNKAMILLVNANEQMYTFALLTLGEKIALWLNGNPPQADAWASLPWLTRGLILLPIFQIIFIIATLKRIKGWQLEPSLKPGRVRMWLLHIILPTVLNLVLVIIAVALLASGMLDFLMLFMGDIVSIFIISGAIALVWILTRTFIILHTLRTTLPLKSTV